MINIHAIFFLPSLSRLRFRVSVSWSVILRQCVFPIFGVFPGNRASARIHPPFTKRQTYRLKGV